MRKRFDDGNCYFDDDCCLEKRKRCDNYCYPSYIDNQVIVRGPTGPIGMPGPMGFKDLLDQLGLKVFKG